MSRRVEWNADVPPLGLPEDECVEDDLEAGLFVDIREAPGSEARHLVHPARRVRRSSTLLRRRPIWWRTPHTKRAPQLPAAAIPQPLTPVALKRAARPHLQDKPAPTSRYG